jgi:hypothetical protein
MGSAFQANWSRIVLKQDSTLIAVIENELVELARCRHRAWRRAPALKKLAVDESALLKLLNRWREEAEKAGRRIERTPSPLTEARPPQRRYVSTPRARRSLMMRLQVLFTSADGRLLEPLAQ